MNSPLIHFFVSYIRLDKQDKTPIYLQISQAIINAIHTKQLAAGNKLPGSRTLSEKLFVHRKTVIAAYEELNAQGWVDIVPQKGAFITAKKLKQQLYPILSEGPTSSLANFKFEKNILLDFPKIASNKSLFFTDGTSDMRLAPLKLINQIFTSVALKKSTLSKINNPSYEANTQLEQQMLNYLRVTKGLSVHTAEILLTTNYQTALYSVIHTLLRPGDTVIVTKLGNYNTNMLLKQAGAELLTVPLKGNDINLIVLSKLIETHKVRAIYIQPNHLYPTTAAISAETKHKLIELANTHQIILIEDDSGCTINYAKNQPITLKSLDRLGSVIYLNSLNDLLPQPYDLGIILAPNNLIPELAKYYNAFQRTNNYLVEETIVEFIREGYLLRHWQKLNKNYYKRREYFEKLIKEKLEQSIQMEKPAMGTAFWVVLHQKLPLLSIAKFCEQNNLALPTHLLYQNKDVTGLRLGFAHLSEIEAEHALHILSKAIHHYMYNLNT